MAKHDFASRYIPGATVADPRFADEDPDAGVNPAFIPSSPGGEFAAFMKAKKKKQAFLDAQTMGPGSGGPSVGQLTAPPSATPGGALGSRSFLGTILGGEPVQPTSANPRGNQPRGSKGGVADAIGGFFGSIGSGEGASGSVRSRARADEALLNQTEFGPEGVEDNSDSLLFGPEVPPSLGIADQFAKDAAAKGEAFKRVAALEAEEDEANGQFLRDLGIEGAADAVTIPSGDGSFTSTIKNEKGEAVTITVPGDLTDDPDAASTFENAILDGKSPAEAKVDADLVKSENDIKNEIAEGGGGDGVKEEGDERPPLDPPAVIEGELLNFAQTFGFEEGAFTDMFARASEGTFTAADRAGLEKALFNARARIPLPEFGTAVGEEDIETPASAARREAFTARLDDFAADVIGQIVDLNKSARKGLALQKFFPDMSQKNLRNLPDSLVESFFAAKEARDVAHRRSVRDEASRIAQGTALSQFFPDIDPGVLQNLPPDLIPALFQQLQFNKAFKARSGAGAPRGVTLPTGAAFEF